MRKPILILVLVALAFPVSAQMDMMPELLRGLPPEILEGLPSSMSFAEYRDLTRNVDFFTMFMSMFVPGYGFFQVEEPALGWAIVGGRLAGYGMMAGAIIDQWDHFQDLTDLAAIDPSAFRRFLGNAVLFGSGIVLNGLLWAVDVIGAYHVANSDRALVRYSYGIRQGLPEGDSPQTLAYLRQISLQDDPAMVQEVVTVGESFLNQGPQQVFAAEAAYRVALAHAELGNDARAVLTAARQLAVYPSEDYDDGSRRLGIYLVNRNRLAWETDIDRLEELFYAFDEATEDAGSGIADFVLELSGLANPVFLDALIRDALDFLRNRPESPDMDAVLLALGRAYETLGSRTEAAGAYLQLAAAEPSSAYWDEAAFRAAEILATHPGGRESALRLYRAILDRRPEGDYGEASRSSLRIMGEAP